MASGKTGKGAGAPDTAASSAKPLSRRPCRRAALIAAMVLSALLVSSTAAYAIPINPIDAIEDFVCGIISGLLQGVVNMASFFISSINTDLLTMVGGEFDRLFSSTGTGGASPMYQFIKSISSGVVKPVAYSLLVFAAMLQLVKIAQKADMTQIMPTFKEIVFLFIFVTVFYVMIRNSLEIMGGIYSFLNTITVWMNDNFSHPGSSTVTIEITNVEFQALGSWMALALILLVMMIMAALAYVVAIFVGYARAIQLYVLALFSPLSLSLLCFEETRQWGINYLKVFASLCLAGALMTVMLYMYPMMLAELLVNGGLSPSGAMLVVDVVSFGAVLRPLLLIIVLSLLLVMGLIKSGSWARDILGG